MLIVIWKNNTAKAGHKPNKYFKETYLHAYTGKWHAIKWLAWAVVSCCVFFFQVSRYLTQLHCSTDLWKSDLCVSFINISNEQADFFNHWNLGTKHSAKCSSEFHATSLKSMACLAGIQGRIWTIINNWNPDKDTQKKQFYKWSTLCKSNCEQEQSHLEKNKWFTLCYFCIGFYCLY